MASREHRTRARGLEAAVQRNRRGDRGRHGCIFSGAVRAAVMTYITTHEDECCGRCAGEAGDVAHGVAWNVEDVEAAVAEEIMGRVLAYFSVGIECDFMYFAIPCVRLSALIDLLEIMGGNTHLKSLSSIGESFFAGYPGMNPSLKPGPT